MGISPHQACYFAHELTRLGAVGEMDRLSNTLFDSKVDLNPHQIDAALFALANPMQQGVILADEVGLGKTIEAGLVLCQKWAERKRRLIVISPAHIRKQWQTELLEKFNLPSVVIDRKVWRQLEREGTPNPLACGKVVVLSYGFAQRIKDDLRATPFDLVVLDEAHKLRNAHQPSRKGGQALRWAFELRDKLLLTATPLQNALLELYGLGWFIGDHVFGDKAAFQSKYGGQSGDLVGLRERLGRFCKRSLRKDCAYINYTKRQALTHPFEQSPTEKKLHEDALAFMQRDISFAFPYRQRHLIEMVLLKSLASSPQALASTLYTLRNRLVVLRDSMPSDDAEGWLDELIDDDLDVESMLDLFDSDEDDIDTSPPAVRGRLLAEELAELEGLIRRAEQIKSDSKSQALLLALRAAFDRLNDLGAQRKALIFTESRKTQAFLAQFLEANGYAGRVVMFNGSNTHPTAKRAYDLYLKKHAGTDKITGSKQIDMRSALIEAFREDGQILLATEAAAEGVNLQFCSLVMNYDLPWNPQRVEQRIGRCHRYGQKHDVVVVNFLSKNNLADRRVHDLLQQKFSLFDGLFGASDEVLGAIEGNIDFEKRVFEILKSCRTDQEITQAFDQLQVDLDDSIQKKMDAAQKQLFEHFDADVHERLNLRNQDAKAALDRVGDRFWRLTHWGLEDHTKLDDHLLGFDLPQAPHPGIPTGKYRLISSVKQEHNGHLEAHDAGNVHLLRLTSPLGVWLLDLAKNQVFSQPSSLGFAVSKHDKKVSVLEPLVGKSGWMRLDKLTLDSDEREEFLLLTGMDESGNNIDQETLQRLMDVDSHPLSPQTLDPTMQPSIEQRLENDAQAIQQATLTRAAESGNERFRQIRAQINAVIDDKQATAEQAIEIAKRELKSARRTAEIAETMQLRVDAENEVERLTSKLKRERQALYDLEDELETERQRLVKDLKRRVEQKAALETLFQIRWKAV